MPTPEQNAKSKQVATLTPSRSLKAFVCPNCNVLAKQDWASVFYTDGTKDLAGLCLGTGLVFVAHCQACRQPSIWLGDSMIHPLSSTPPMPLQDMPEDVKTEYMEARDVFGKSARAAGGLLRIAFEKLFPHLGVNKNSPNEAIAELVKNGLVLGTQQQALDVMRIFANQSSHNGFVKLEDQPATVSFLFGLLNYIVEQMITKPKQIQSLYATIPQDKRDGIAKRDAKK
jgi:hypothetical protein